MLSTDDFFYFIFYLRELDSEDLEPCQLTVRDFYELEGNIVSAAHG